LTTCPYFVNLEFDIFDAVGPQCHFIRSVTIAVRIRILSVLSVKLSLVCSDIGKSLNVRPSLKCN